MKKILFISSTDLLKQDFGGSKVSIRNYKILKKKNDVDLIFFSRKKIKNKVNTEKCFVMEAPKNKFYTFLNNLFLYSSDLTFFSERKILKLIKKEKYDVIFLDTSNFGRLAKKIKILYPQKKVITFFHNVEYDFMINRMKVEGYWYIFNLLSTNYNEKKSIEYSDYIITLNNRDTKRIQEKYSRKSDLELPISLEENKIIFKELEQENNEEKIYLFIGSLFYANYHGIKWFVERVMPYVNGKLIIVGKNFELKRTELEKKNVVVIGSTENIEKYYQQADAVVAPIFTGAGMKVKIAEALMYGKRIFGTTEAFEGYELNFSKVGGICNTDKEFINELNLCKKGKLNEYSRKVFEENYSYKNSEYKMEIFLEKI